MKPKHQTLRTIAGGVVLALVVAACSSDGSDGAAPFASSTLGEDTGSGPVDSASESDPTSSVEKPGTSTDSSEPSDPVNSGPSNSVNSEAGPDFAGLDPPTGQPIVIGMVNTEGTPGLDFPEMRTDTDLAVDYLNQHGGMGGRPVQIEHCAAAGSPETSQACAQELTGKDVGLVMLGLDVFPGYDTFAASGIPVFGALPILPGDYTADALFVTGGNATTMAAMVALAVREFDAATVGIISADNPGSNASEASLTGALDKAGVSYVSVKGGDNETDAGFQGLLRQANEDNPDVLVSLYADAGCIGSIRGRVALGIDTPTISTPICGSSEVIDVVGDDAVGWYYAGVGTPDGSPTAKAFDAIIEPTYGEDATGSLGVGALGITQVMTLARVANDIAASGGEVTGAAIYEAMASTTEIREFPNENVLACGTAPSYPSVCSFIFPIGEYVAGGEIRTVPGFEAVDVVEYLP